MNSFLFKWTPITWILRRLLQIDRGSTIDKRTMIPFDFSKNGFYIVNGNWNVMRLVEKKLFQLKVSAFDDRQCQMYDGSTIDDGVSATAYTYVRKQCKCHRLKPKKWITPKKRHYQNQENNQLGKKQKHKSTAEKTWPMKRLTLFVAHLKFSTTTFYVLNSHVDHILSFNMSKTQWKMSFKFV